MNPDSQLSPDKPNGRQGDRRPPAGDGLNGKTSSGRAGGQPRAAESSGPVPTYVHLLRAANQIFEEETLERLALRVRSKRPAAENSDDPLVDLDPVAGTEALAIDFVRRGGKHSRPFMTLATYDAVSGGQATGPEGLRAVQQFSDSVLRAAMSIEMFHKASLIHDDIEDDDSYRYGKPTLHRRYGLPSAINVGDYLIGLGYRLVSRDAGELGASCAADILDCLAAAHTRLAEGQGAELLWRDARNKRLTPLDALKIYALKTAPAFEAALYTGARLAGPAHHLSEPIKVFARNLGVAFQILNDLADWEGDQVNKLTAGGDVLGGRPTLLWALALAALSDSEQDELLSLANPNRELEDRAKIKRVGELYRQVHVFEQAHQLIEKHKCRAVEAVAQLKSEAMQRLLMYLVETVLESRPHSEPKFIPVQPGGNLPIAAG